MPTAMITKYEEFAIPTRCHLETVNKLSLLEIYQFAGNIPSGTPITENVASCQEGVILNHADIASTQTAPGGYNRRPQKSDAPQNHYVTTFLFTTDAARG